jgi:hypothetical protein
MADALLKGLKISQTRRDEHGPAESVERSHRKCSQRPQQWVDYLTELFDESSEFHSAGEHV